MSFDLAKLLEFDLKTGLSPNGASTKRHLSNLKGMFADEKALESELSREDRLVYEFYELGVKETDGNLAFGTTITYPGKVGDEFYLTKGHFHTILDTAEVYYCLSGKGVMLMENPEGDVKYEVLTAGKAVYVPGRYAHRSINIGTEPFVQFFCFRADAGHDYGTIESRGFRKLIVEKDGGFSVIDNPKWKG